jgi:hypothetical protein
MGINKCTANIIIINAKSQVPPPIPIDGAKKMSKSGSPQPMTIHIQ